MRKATRVVVCRTALVMVMAMAASLAGATENEVAMQQMPDHVVVPGTVEGAAEDYVSPLVIPGASWRNDGFNLDSYFFWFYLGGVQAASDADSGCFMAPVYIKPGVTITEFWSSVYDSDTDEDFYVALRKVDHYNGTVTLITNLGPTGGSAGMYQMSDIGLSEVTDTSHTYYLTTCLYSNNHRVVNSRLWYTE